MQEWIKKAYVAFRGSKFTFRLVVRLKELGVLHFLKRILGIKYKPKEEMMDDTARFIKDNKERIQKMLHLFADEESRTVWKTVMECRKQGKPIPEKFYSERDQYFVPDVVRLHEGEAFVDCGAFIGDTLQHLLNFAKKQGVSVRKMVAFEPDPQNIAQLNRNFKNDERLHLIPKGVSDREGMFQFFPDSLSGTFADISSKNASSIKREEECISLPVTTIDSQEECVDATFIKMDIEGAELSALHGAHDVIERNHPTLAICIYHSLEDMVGIFEYLHENFPEYDFYVRHHSMGASETVMYAIMPS